MRISLLSALLLCFIIIACQPKDGEVPGQTDPVLDDSAKIQAALDDYNAHYVAYTRTNVRWTNGDVGSCTAGTLSTGMQDTFIHVVNYFRRQCYLPEVTAASELHNDCMEAALMFKANLSTSANPPNTWTCYTAEGAAAAGASALAAGPDGTEAVWHWIQESGTATANYHCANRTRLLHMQGTAYGYGANDYASVLYTSHNLTEPQTPPEYVAYPPARYFPSTLVPNRWSFTLPGANFANCTISMGGPNINNPIILQKNLPATTAAQSTVTWDIASLQLPPPGGYIRYQVTLDGVVVQNQTKTYSYTVIIFNPIQ